VGFNALSAAEEHLSITGSFGFVVNPSDVIMGMFLELVRLNADAIEITWQTDQIAYVKFATRSVRQ
jgi:hypothetical protein